MPTASAALRPEALRLTCLAIPNNPRFDARRPLDEFTALGRDASGADIAASARSLG